VSIFDIPYHIDRILIIIITITVIISSVPPQLKVTARADHRIYFETITIENGLSSNNITTIVQDSYGYLWFGTSNGLNKYDGINFDIFIDNPINNTLSDSSINILYVTSDGELWIGTSWGLNKYDRTTNTFINYLNEQDDVTSISDNFITSICEDSDGNIWIGTKKGLNKLDRVTETFSLYLNSPNDTKSLSNDFITSICEDNYGYLWIGTIDGLNRLDRNSQEFTIYRNDTERKTSISNNYVTCIYEGSDSNLWIGTTYGLNKYDRESDYFKVFVNDANDITSLSNDYVTSICEDFSGYLWVGTKLGINRLDTSNETFYIYRYNPDDPFSLSYDRIQAIYRDIEGNIWIGTLNGCDKVNFKKQAFNYYIDALYNNAVPGIASNDSKIIWLKTRYGLFKFNNETKSVEKIYNEVFINQNFSNVKMNTFCISINGCLWAGTEGYGLEMFNPVTEELIVYKYDENSANCIPSDTVLSLYINSDGDILWIGTDKGLCSFNITTGKFNYYAYEIENDNIWYIYQTSDNDLWISTETGFYRIDYLSGILTPIVDYTQLSGSLYTNIISDVLEDSRGLLWFANGNNLFCYDIDKETIVPTGLETNFPPIAVRSILEDDNNSIWLSTASHGLIKISANDESIKQYGKDDGLQNDTFCYRSSYKAEDGELFFGCIVGLISFYPDDLIEDIDIPDVYITNFALLNKDISFTEPIEDVTEIKLPYADNSFEIDFVAFDYKSPEYNQYAYKLEGFDEKWNYCNAINSYAKYTNIPLGEYIFIIKASNSDGIWNEEGVSLKIIIAPPFWQQWWFIFILIMAAILLVFMVIWLRTYTIRKYSQILESKYEERTYQLIKKTEQLENELKKRTEFTRALAHELKTPLTPLLSASEFLLNSVEDDITLGFINNIRQGILNLEKRINELLDLAKGEIGLIKINREYVDVLNIIKNTMTYFMPEAQRKNQELILDIPDTLPEIFADEERITQVILNLLNNASKFTRKNGEIIIKAKEEKASLIIEVIDNGCGIDEAEQEHIFEPYSKLRLKRESSSGLGLGLYLAKLFVELHGGKIWVISSKGKGSTFAFSLPIEHNNIDSGGNDL
jgi:signal transduction histidine kinase/ligand-binding sensor domain-containing protein